MRLLRIFKSELAHDARTWVKKGHISRSQAEAILADYGTEWPSGVARTRGTSVLLGLGVLLMGLSVLVFVGANWAEIPRSLRLGGLIGLTALVNGLGIWLWQQGREVASRAVLFGGALVYGASIFLIGQTYHLGEHFPEGLFFWALGVLPVAFITRSRAVALVASLIAMLWMGTELLYQGFHPLYAGFLAAQIAFVGYCQRSLSVFMLTVFGAGLALELAVIELLERSGAGIHGEPIVLLAVWFLAMYVLARVLEHQTHSWARDYGVCLQLWTVRFGLLALLPLTFGFGWEILEDGLRGVHLPTLWIGVGSIVGLALGGVGWAMRQGRTDREQLGLAVPVICWAAMLGFCLFAAPLGEEIVPFAQLLTTVMLLGAGAWLAAAGARNGSAVSFYLGIGVVLATAFCRYIDLVGDYLGSSLFFMICGALFAVAARIWHRLSLREEIA